MESIIDRVINELVFRLTNSGRSARSGNSVAEQQQAQIAPQPTPQRQEATISPAPRAPQAQPTSQAPAPPQAPPAPQVQSGPPSQSSQPMPEPTPQPETTDALVERELQRVVAEARQELDAAVVIVAEIRASADGFSERIAATSERLDGFDSWLDSAPAPQPQAPAQAPAAQPPAPVQPQVSVPVPPAPQVSAPPVQHEPWGHVETAPDAPDEFVPQAPEPNLAPHAATPVPAVYPGADQFAAEAAVPQTRTVSLTVASLSNLTVVSVVEAALLRITGVREVALRQLQGRKAILEVRLDEGTGLISGLRKSLPLAFDVTESSDHTLEITLSYVAAQPQPTNGGGGAGPALA
jgi:hypothetical protein